MKKSQILSKSIKISSKQQKKKTNVVAMQCDVLLFDSTQSKTAKKTRNDTKTTRNDAKTMLSDAKRHINDAK